LLVLNDGVVNYYPYGYNQYMSKKEDKSFTVKEEVKKEKPEVKMDRNALKKELSDLEKLINTKEKRIKEIELEFEKEEVYSDFMIMQELENESEELEDEIQSLTLKWEEIVVLLEEKSN
jgi:ATP-binding cassette subfamily F protein 3